MLTTMVITVNGSRRAGRERARAESTPKLPPGLGRRNPAETVTVAQLCQPRPTRHSRSRRTKGAALIGGVMVDHHASETESFCVACYGTLAPEIADSPRAAAFLAPTAHVQVRHDGNAAQLISTSPSPAGTGTAAADGADASSAFFLPSCNRGRSCQPHFSIRRRRRRRPMVPNPRLPALRHHPTTTPLNSPPAPAGS